MGNQFFNFANHNPMKLQSTLQKLPEYYIVLIALLAGYTPPFSFNPVFVGIAAIVLLQIIFKNRVSGLVLAGLFFLCNLLFLGALISEFIEFTEFTRQAMELILVGIPLWLLNLVLSVVMFFSYSNNGHRTDLVSDLKIK